MALDFLPARKKESWYFIQHKLPLLYSLGVNKVIVGKVECAVHVDGLLLHKKDPSLLLAGHKCSTVFLPRQGEFRIRFPENPPLGLWVLAHSRGDFRPGGGAAPPAGPPFSHEKGRKECQRERGSLPLETLSGRRKLAGLVRFGGWWGCRFLIVTPYRSAPTGWARLTWSGTLRVRALHEAPLRTNAEGFPIPLAPL